MADAARESHHQGPRRLGRGQRITVLFNPTEYSFERANAYKATAVPGLGSPLIQFVNGERRRYHGAVPRRLHRPDGARRSGTAGPSEARQDRLDEITTLLDIDRDLHAPPPVRFIWGPMHFDAVLEKLGRKVTHVPARRHAGARHALGRVQGVPDAARSSSRTRAANRPTRPSAAISAAESIWLIADTEYGDPRGWRFIAHANDLDDPRELRPGDWLRCRRWRMPMELAALAERYGDLYAPASSIALGAAGSDMLQAHGLAVTPGRGRPAAERRRRSSASPSPNTFHAERADFLTRARRAGARPARRSAPEVWIRMGYGDRARQTLLIIGLHHRGRRPPSPKAASPELEVSGYGRDLPDDARHQRASRRDRRRTATRSTRSPATTTSTLRFAGTPPRSCTLDCRTSRATRSSSRSSPNFSNPEQKWDSTRAPTSAGQAPFPAAPTRRRADRDAAMGRRPAQLQARGQPRQPGLARSRSTAGTKSPRRRSSASRARRARGRTAPARAAASIQQRVPSAARAGAAASPPGVNRKHEADSAPPPRSTSAPTISSKGRARPSVFPSCCPIRNVALDRPRRQVLEDLLRHQDGPPLDTSGYRTRFKIKETGLMSLAVHRLRLESRHEAGGSVAGVATATVTQNDDPEGLGRVKLSFPGTSSRFRELLGAPRRRRWPATDRGAVFLPEVGDEVLVAFDRDDLRFPMCSARCGARPTSRRKPTATARTTCASSSRARATSCASTTAAKGASIELSDGKKVEIDDDGIRVDDKGNTITLDARAARSASRPTADADAQGAEDHDRSHGLARPQGRRHAERQRRHREDQLMGQPAARVGDHDEPRHAAWARARRARRC